MAHCRAIICLYVFLQSTSCAFIVHWQRFSRSQRCILSHATSKAADERNNLVVGSFNNQTLPNTANNATVTTQLSLPNQLRALRDEIAQAERELEQHKLHVEQKKLDKLDRQLRHALVAVQVDQDTQMLHTVERVADILHHERYSPEQVYRMFELLTADDPATLVNSPVVELLVAAAGLVDCLDEDERTNARWDQRVEMKLRKQMFAMQNRVKMEPESAAYDDRFF